MKKIYSRPASLKKAVFHYCPGCGHSVVHRIIAELIDEMNLRDVAVGIPPPGCAVFTYNYFDIDMAESAHGRGAAVATGLKRASPGTFVFTYQGDGDLAAKAGYQRLNQHLLCLFYRGSRPEGTPWPSHHRSTSTPPRGSSSSWWGRARVFPPWRSPRRRAASGTPCVWPS